MSSKSGQRLSVQSSSICFGITASVWVCMYEYLFSPKAYHDMLHGNNMDELHGSVARLHDKRAEMRERLINSIADVKRLGKRDPRILRSRVAAIRRLKAQLDRMDVSIGAIENNIDQVLTLNGRWVYSSFVRTYYTYSVVFFRSCTLTSQRISWNPSESPLQPSSLLGRL